ncbi:MAG: DUF2752 domain-containing protein [Propionicimonas sp.]|uniref:DUF2752 domain-containing protein n=1 Tax=Propionicimonas sp. TaxID=1955623 RepID=UPI003D0EA2A9
MPNADASRAAAARLRLRSVAVFGAVGLTLSGAYAVAGVGVPCPWRALTHTLCPFCGSTTLGASLLHGDVAAAWRANPFVFLLLVGLALASVGWLVEALGGPTVRLPGRRLDQRRWYIGLGVVAIGFAVVRNLVPLG